jgi:phosphatidate cytidylyltransferase
MPDHDPAARDVTLSAAPASRAGRNLPAAIGVGLGLGALVLISLFAYRPSFAVIVGLTVVYGSYELSKAIGHADIRVSLTPIVVGGVAMLVSAWLRGPKADLVIGGTEGR